MTQEDIDLKVTQLSAQYGVVIPISITVEGEKIVGFFRKATYDLILYTMDCIVKEEMSKAGEALVKGCLIASESNIKILDRDNHPEIAASFAIAAMKLSKVFAADKDEVKKN